MAITQAPESGFPAPRVSPEVVTFDIPIEHVQVVPRWKRFGAGGLLALGLGGVGGAAIGAYEGIHQPTETVVGGNYATVQLERGHSHVVDTGMTGTVELKSRLAVPGLSFGSNIDMKGVTQEATGDAPLNPQVLREYLQLFNDPQHDIATAKHDILAHVGRDAERGAAYGLLIAMVGLVAVARMDPSRRDHLNAALAMSPRTRRLSAAGLTVAALSAAYASFPVQDHYEGKVLTALDGTSMQGLKATGPIESLGNTYGQTLRSFFDSTDTFDNHARQKFNTQFSAVGISREKAPGVVRLLAISDRHCNTGMDRIVEAAAKAYGADYLVTAGDDDFSGTYSFEAACTGGLAGRLQRSHLVKKGMVAELGNHDSTKQTGLDEKKQGYKVLPNNIPTAVGNVVFLGSRDPRRSIFMHGTIVPSGKSAEQALDEQADQLIEAACNSTKPVDIADVHDPTVGARLAASGCVKLVLDGHIHTLHAPQQFENPYGPANYQLILGSTGGAKTDSLTIGKPMIDATMTVIDYNTVTHEPVNYSNAIVHPDGSVTVTRFTPFNLTDQDLLRKPPVEVQSQTASQPTPQPLSGKLTREFALQ